MRPALALLLLAACTEHGSSPHYVLTVLSVPGAIDVYRSENDLCCTATEPLPDPGACVEATNTSTCRTCDEQSCFTTFELARDDGAVFDSSSAGSSNKIALTVPDSTTFVTLLARGCGADVTAPIPIGLGPHPDLLSTYRTDGTVDLTWTTDTPAGTAFASAGLQSCQTTGASQHFTGFPGSGSLVTSVSTFDLPVTIPARPNIDIVVYTGNRSTVMATAQ